MIRRCVSVIAVFLLLLSGLAILPQGAKADNPIEHYTLSFSSMSDIDRFFQTHSFYIAKYDRDSGEWKEDAIIPKNIVYEKNKLYVIAPYFYDDENGYPNLIPNSGIMINLQNLDNPNATIVITGFSSATITINNVRCKVDIGRSVAYQGHGVNKGAPPLWSYIGVGSLIYLVGAGANYFTIRHGVWSGESNTYLNIQGVSDVEVENYYVSVGMQTPIVVSGVENLTFRNLHIAPPNNVMTGGAMAMLTDVGNVSFEGVNYIRGYATAFSMKRVGNVINRGYVYIDGSSVLDGKSEKGGTGIYADGVGNYTAMQDSVDASGQFFTGVIGEAYYNETNHTIWGNISSVVLAFHNGHNNGSYPQEPMFYDYRKVIYFVGNVSENITNETGSATGYFQFSRGEPSIHFTAENDTLGLDVEGWFALSDVNIVWLYDSQVRNGTNGSVRLLKFAGETITNSGAYIRGKLPYGFVFSALDSGVSVPDDGAKEREFIKGINATATFLDVNHRILFNASYQNEVYAVNYGMAFGGLTAIVGVLVSVGWMRVGMLTMSPDANKRKQGKDMIMKASIGTIIVAFVLFGWANALGLFNWVMGG